jgi:uncharacterized protein YbaP (TraB family)
MKKLKIGFLIAFLSGTFPVFIFGQHLADFPTKSNTLLWKIEGKKVKKDSYIFGTIHIIEKQRFYFPEHFRQLVANSEQVVLEIGNLNQMEALSHMMLQKGTLFDYFTPEQADSILVWAKSSMGMEPEQFKMALGKMKPFAVVQLASQKDLIGKIESYDLTIQSVAVEKDIPVIGLETIAQQIAIFDNMDSLKQRDMVMEVIRNPEEQDAVLHVMYDIYLGQNVDHMYQYINEQGGSLMESSDELLTKRNHDWIPKIEELIQKKRTLIAVGAGHLGGEEGVLRLLEKKGYKLTPVQF